MTGSGGRHALAFVFITVLIDMIGFGIVIPVMPELIMELTGEGLSQAAIYGGCLLFLYALLQFFTAPVIGNLSDRFGRRPVLLLSLTAFGLDYVLMGLVPTLAWLFVGRFVAGVVGGSYVTANAFIADVSAPEDRAKNFGLVPPGRRPSRPASWSWRRCACSAGSRLDAPSRPRRRRLPADSRLEPACAC